MATSLSEQSQVKPGQPLTVSRKPRVSIFSASLDTHTHTHIRTSRLVLALVKRWWRKRGARGGGDLSRTTLTCLNSNLSTSIDRRERRNTGTRRRGEYTGDMSVQVHVDKDLNFLLSWKIICRTAPVKGLTIFENGTVRRTVAEDCSIFRFEYFGIFLPSLLFFSFSPNRLFDIRIIVQNREFIKIIGEFSLNF